MKDIFTPQLCRKILYYILIFILIFFIYNNLYYQNYKPKVYVFDTKIKGPTVFILGSVHGNEPAGTYTTIKLIKNLINYKSITSDKNHRLKKGKIIILPIPNPYGIKYNSRFQPKLFNADINRNYINNGVDKMSKIIISLAKKSDYIIDLHEGWGFHKSNKYSLGSTLTINTKPYDKKLINIGNDIVNILNSKIYHDKKKFTLLLRDKNKCKPYGSFGCWSEINNKKYILVETSGQNNVQKLQLRVNQQSIIILNLLKKIDII